MAGIIRGTLLGAVFGGGILFACRYGSAYQSLMEWDPVRNRSVVRAGARMLPFWQTMEPALVLMALFALGALLSVALIIETALKKEPGEEKKAIDWKSPGMIHVYIMLGIVVGFVVLMKIVGMLLALLIMIPAIEYLMGCRSKVMLIALPVGMVAFVYLFFVVAMKLTLPAPIWA